MPTPMSTDPSGGGQLLPFPGRVIKAGDTDHTIVFSIQRRLNAVGCGLAVVALARRAALGLVGVVMLLGLGCSETDHGTPAGQSEPPTGQPGTSAVTLAPAGQPLAIVQSALARRGHMANHI